MICLLFLTNIEANFSPLFIFVQEDKLPSSRNHHYTKTTGYYLYCMLIWLKLRQSYMADFFPKLTVQEGEMREDAQTL